MFNDMCDEVKMVVMLAFFTAIVIIFSVFINHLQTTNYIKNGYEYRYNNGSNMGTWVKVENIDEKN